MFLKSVDKEWIGSVIRVGHPNTGTFSSISVMDEIFFLDSHNREDELAVAVRKYGWTDARVWEVLPDIVLSGVGPICKPKRTCLAQASRQTWNCRRDNLHTVNT